MKQPKYNIGDFVKYLDSGNKPTFRINSILFVDGEFYYSKYGSPDVNIPDIGLISNGLVKDLFFLEESLQLIEDKDETT